MFVWKENNQLKLLEIEEFASANIKAYFTSRLGGVSTGNYAGLNLGLHTGDNPDNVLENRKILADSIGVNYSEFVAAEQIHSNQVYLVTKKDLGRGALLYKESISGIDGIITATKGIPLISFYADCVPLYIIEPERKIAALAHAGWKGTAKKIVVNTINKMINHFNIKVENCWAAIGPSISKDHYEVDQTVMKYFQRNINFWRDLVVDLGKGHYLLDLQLANRLLFQEAGIPAEQIIDSGYCTYQDNELFYSYRKEQGVTGRMASIIYF